MKNRLINPQRFHLLLNLILVIGLSGLPVSVQAFFQPRSWSDSPIPLAPTLAPVTADDEFSISEDGILTVPAPGVLSNDSDPESDPLQATLDTLPASGLIEMALDGSFIYTPTLDFNGQDIFSYIASDGALTATATVTLTITAVNDIPVAAADLYDLSEDTPLSISAPGVLTNDTDVDGDSLSAAVLTQPISGTLNLLSDGSFSYTPDANFNGSDSFTYTLSDGTETDTGTVTLNIAPAADPPVAQDDSFDAAEDTTLNIAAPGVLGNDSDPDGDSLSAAVVTGPSSGTLNLLADGSFTYTPDTNFNGLDTFTYTASDGSLSDTATVEISVGAANDAPVTSADAYTTDEDVQLSVPAPGVLGNDSDPDADSLSASVSIPPDSGTLNLLANGSFTYTPDPDFNGSDTFTYLASDGSLSTPAVVNITVDPVNDAPSAANDSYTTPEDQALTVTAPGVLGNDTDIDGDGLTAAVLTQPTSGTLNLLADGSFTYTPAADFNGPVSFTYTASDGAASDSATVNLTISAANDAPLAVDDSYSTNKNITLSVPAPGVLGNDSDPENSPLTASLVTPPTQGVLEFFSDGSFTFEPPLNFSGDLFFTYQVSDGSLVDTGTVNLTVLNVNTPPFIVDDSATTPEDVTVLIDVLLNDYDLDGTIDPLSLNIVTPPTHGSATVNPSERIQYIPGANYSGADQLTYRACDNLGACSSAEVAITITAVNDAPVAVDDTGSTGEDTTLSVSAPGVLANDSDVEGTPLTASLVSGPVFGDLTLNSNGGYSYTPDANFHGEDVFTYQASDGALASSAVVTITITPVNDTPVAVADTYDLNEDTPLNVAAPGVLANDSDLDGDTLSAFLVSPPASGSLTLNPDGSFSYVPALNVNGSTSFTYRATDGTLSTNAIVTLNIAAVNDAPAANNETYNATEDTPLNVSAPGVLANDSDVDSASLSVSLLVPPTLGSLNLQTNGAFSYTPNPNAEGTDSFSYQVSDGSLTDNATTTIVIAGVNDAPIAANDVFTGTANTDLVIPAPGVLFNDSDVDDASLSVSVITAPLSGTLTLQPDGAFTYTPNPDFIGVDSFTYSASDGELSDSAEVTLNILTDFVNTAPSANDDFANPLEDSQIAMNVLLNDSDAEGNLNPDSLAIVELPLHGAASVNLTNHTLLYFPDTDYVGPDTLTYQVCDLYAACDTALVTIGVTQVNDPPNANADAAGVGEDGSVIISVLANDNAGPANENQSLEVVSSTQPQHGSALVLPDQTISYAPAADYCGADSFSYTIEDLGGLQDSALVSLTVNCVNDPPSAANDAAVTEEDTPLGIAVLANDSDLEDNIDPDSLEIITPPAHGQAVVDSLNGQISYSPAFNYFGSDGFGYRICDSGGLCDTASVSLTISPVNDPPIALDDSVLNAIEDTPVGIDVLANDSAGPFNEDQSLVIQSLTQPLHGSAAANQDGTITYQPAANYCGSDTFSYTAADSGGLSDAALVAVEIACVNDAPDALDDQYITNENELVISTAAGLLQNDSDPEGDALSASVVSLPQNGSLSLNPDGSFTYTAEAGFNGEDSFTYQVSDGALASTAVVIIIVDTILPTISYVSPTSDYLAIVYQDSPEVSVLLSVSAVDNLEIAYVKFERFDWRENRYITLAEIDSPPYELVIELGALAPEWNQINAYAFDTAGNSAATYIFIYYRKALYAPIIRR